MWLEYHCITIVIGKHLISTYHTREGKDVGGPEHKEISGLLLGGVHNLSRELVGVSAIFYFFFPIQPFSGGLWLHKQQHCNNFYSSSFLF